MEKEFCKFLVHMSNSVLIISISLLKLVPREKDAVTPLDFVLWFSGGFICLFSWNLR